MGTSRAKRDAIATDEIIVSSDHVAVVQYELDKLREMDVLAADAEVADEDDCLRLAKIKIRYRPDVVAAQSTVFESTAGTDVSEIIDLVRDRCRYQYRGWIPTMGKNRVLSGIGGEGGQVTGGGGQVTGGGGQVTGGGGQVTGGGGGYPDSIDADVPSFQPSTRGAGVHIAVVDTPVYQRGSFEHLDVEYHDNRYGADLDELEVLPYEAGHATFILGLIARKASGAHVDVVPVLDSHAAGDSWEIARTLARLPDDISVVNLSLGCYTFDDQPPLVLQRAMEILTPRVLVVAAAGNHRQPMRPRPFWPAAMDNVVAVGALDGTKEADFSPRAPWVGAMAQGVRVESTYLDGTIDVGGTDRKFNGMARWRGTSFAAATVVGEITSRLGPHAGGRRARAVLQQLIEDPDSVVEGSRFRPRFGP